MNTFTTARSAVDICVAGRWLLALACMLALALAVSAAGPRDAWAGEPVGECGDGFEANMGLDYQLLDISWSGSGSGNMYYWDLSCHALSHMVDILPRVISHGQ